MTRRDGELLVVTPWYPNPENPYAGTFVRESVRALLPYYQQVTVVHVENRPPDDDRAPTWSDTDEGRVLWIGVPMDPMTSRGGMMLAQREALTRHAAELLQAAPVVHAHVGAPTGAALVPLLRPDARVVLTEHATYLSKVFRDPQARQLYRDIYRRADVVTAVSSVTARFIEDTFPGDRDQVTVVANPVRISALPVKTDLTVALSRWLYVGNLTPHKGVRRLVKAFARWVEYTRDEHARLTVVGTGPLHDELGQLAAELGVADRVHLAGAVQPDQIGQVYLDADVLVHLSHIETFGLTCVEAAACGLPVVVTDCGGPPETLAVHAALGLAAFVYNVDEDDVETIVDKLSELQRTIDPRNIPLSRHHLQRCYSREAVGAMLHAALTGEAVDEPPPYDGMRVLGVALTDKQAVQTEAALRNFASFGGGGVYLAGRPPHGPLPPSIRVVDISRIETGNLLVRLERAVLEQAPAATLAWAGNSAEAALAPDVAHRMADRIDRLRQRHRSVVRRVRTGPYDYAWRNVGPWYVARRLVDSGTLDALDMSTFDCFVLPDDFATPIAFRALQLNPELDVRRRWTRTAIARIYAERVLLPARAEISGEEDYDPDGEDEADEVPQDGPIP